MNGVESLKHTQWECKYHVVFIPKYRRKALFGQIRRYLGETYRELAAQKESRIEEGHVMPDHVHMLISIPPKYSISQVIGFLSCSLATAHPTNKRLTYFKNSHESIVIQSRNRRQKAKPHPGAIAPGSKPRVGPMRTLTLQQQ